MKTETKITYREGDTVFARVAHQMGGWKWGYPRGQRRAIVRYVARPGADGTLRWYSDGEVCSGLTAANVEYYTEHYPIVATHSLHRTPCNTPAMAREEEQMQIKTQAELDAAPSGSYVEITPPDEAQDFASEEKPHG